MPTQEQYEAGLEFLTELLRKQEATSDKLVPFTEWIIDQTMMAMTFITV